jgi:molybdopterin-guanine dinucleotide biosynthesis protein A
MTTKINTINGYILAGGKSSRMGMDKGLMVFNGKAIVQRVMEQMKPAVNKLVIVSNNPEYEKFGLEVVVDIIKNIGPAGGIHAALNHTNAEKNFLVSCDMPFITTGSIEFIIRHSLQSQITVPVYQCQTEPLFGIYSKECLTKWQELIQQGIIKLQDIISHFSLLKLDVDGNPLFYDSPFTNINTQDDFKEAIKKSKNEN